MLLASAVLTTRPTWTRGLTLCNAARREHLATPCDDHDDDAIRVHSWFRSLVDPRRFALYSVRQDGVTVAPYGLEEQTLVVVREFRRVPLFASALALTLFTARAGHAAAVVATLAHFAERAISLFQPAYLLLARSLEQPRVAVLVTGVHEESALLAASPSAFSLEPLLPELAPMLAVEPERFTYHRDPVPSERAALVSPHAV